MNRSDDRTDRESVQTAKGIKKKGRLLSCLKDFYDINRICLRVRVEREIRKWFEVNLVIRQACVMSLWSFNMFVDWVLREINKRM